MGYNAVAEFFNGAIKREWLYRRIEGLTTLKMMEFELFD